MATDFQEKEAVRYDKKNNWEEIYNMKIIRKT